MHACVCACVRVLVRVLVCMCVCVYVCVCMCVCMCVCAGLGVYTTCGHVCTQSCVVSCTTHNETNKQTCTSWQQCTATRFKETFNITMRTPVIGLGGSLFVPPCCYGEGEKSRRIAVNHIHTIDDDFAVISYRKNILLWLAYSTMSRCFCTPQLENGTIVNM